MLVGGASHCKIRMHKEKAGIRWRKDNELHFIIDVFMGIQLHVPYGTVGHRFGVYRRSQTRETVDL